VTTRSTPGPGPGSFRTSSGRRRDRRRPDGARGRDARAAERAARDGDDVPSAIVAEEAAAAEASVGGAAAIGMGPEEAPPPPGGARAARSAAAQRTREEVVAGLAAEIAQTAQKMLRDHASVADLRLVNAALKEMRYAFRVFAPYQRIRKVSIFGSARTPQDHPAYRHAHEFARRLADRGYMVITGGGGGIMRACQEGSGRRRSFGINIRLPFEQQPNEFIHRDPKLVNFKYFFTRKLMFVKEADAIALFPGGFGTHDEGFESLTLVQTGKSRPVPIVFVDAPGGAYWQTWKRYVEDHLLAEGLISEADMRLFVVTDDLDRAIEEITGFYRRYHSSRYVGDHLVLRLTSPLAPADVAALGREFADIVASGEIAQTGALPEEAGEPELADLPRLVFHFTRRHFGRLRMLVDAVNAAPDAADQLSDERQAPIAGGSG
jgi:uncharacterized protein (TIGR00730 family)